MSQKDVREPNHVTIHVMIFGKVQGVSYRASLRNRAEELNVGGWTRNLPDGEVEALLQGKDKDVDALLEWCRVGPKFASVDSVKQERLETRAIYRSFSILF